MNSPDRYPSSMALACSNMSALSSQAQNAYFHMATCLPMLKGSLPFIYANIEDK